MKKYIQPSMEEMKLSAFNTFMISASMEGTELEPGGNTDTGGVTSGDAALRPDELEYILSLQRNGWEGGLW